MGKKLKLNYANIVLSFAIIKINGRAPLKDTNRRRKEKKSLPPPDDDRVQGVEQNTAAAHNACLHF
jgi:hypothetical protein